MEDYKYLELKKSGRYEYVERKIGKDGAVVIVPIKRGMDQLYYQLILSMRPTFDKPILEFPAGLIDKIGESLEELTLRELREETGWLGKVLKISSIPYPSSAGLSTELLYMAVVDLDQLSTSDHQAGENITILPLMSVDGIMAYIEAFADQILVSSRVGAYLMGVGMQTWLPTDVTLQPKHLNLV
jgi:ADP-ribose pyrophosphatase